MQIEIKMMYAVMFHFVLCTCNALLTASHSKHLYFCNTVLVHFRNKELVVTKNHALTNPWNFLKLFRNISTDGFAVFRNKFDSKLLIYVYEA